MSERPILFSDAMIRAILEGRKTQTRRVIKQAVRDPDRMGNSPYGIPGDRLWVREAWAYDPYDASRAFYRATDTDAVLTQHPTLELSWHPSIHMPRWASRITLQIAAVRVERVQDITEADARAEGVELTRLWVESFRLIWDRINAKRGYGWDANPWVWVISFEVLEKMEAGDE